MENILFSFSLFFVAAWSSHLVHLLLLVIGPEIQHSISVRSPTAPMQWDAVSSAVGSNYSLSEVKVEYRLWSSAALVLKAPHEAQLHPKVTPPHWPVFSHLVNQPLIRNTSAHPCILPHAHPDAHMLSMAFKIMTHCGGGSGCGKMWSSCQCFLPHWSPKWRLPFPQELRPFYLSRPRKRDENNRFAFNRPTSWGRMKCGRKKRRTRNYPWRQM